MPEMVRRSITAFFILSVLIGFTTISRAQDSEILIIAHKSFSETNVSERDVSRIFHGSKRNLNNTAIRQVAFLENNPTHTAFIDRFIGKSEVSFRNFWKRLVFTGKNPMPRYFRQEADMVAFVSSHSNTIGYISAGTPHENVKVLGSFNKSQ